MKSLRLSKEQFGWAFYDFANSAYATTMITAIFSVYFVSQLVPAEGAIIAGQLIPAESVWSYLVSLVMICVVLIAPILGSMADQKGTKRLLIAIWTLFGGVSTLFLFGATPGRFHYGLLFAFLSFLGYEMAVVFYNAFINEVAEEKEKGWVSGYGFALGYLGGGLCLAINSVMIAKPDFFGLGGNDPSLRYRACFFMVGVWWLVFSIPTFLWVRDKKRAHQKAIINFAQFFLTVKKILKIRNIGPFLLAYLLYNDGIQTLIIMASIFGANVLGMTIQQLGLCILLIQFVAFFGALFFGRLADSFGHKKTVLLTLGIYFFITVWAYFMSSQVEFWMMGIIVGLILGGSQAASRSLYAQMVPKGQEGELFGVYSVVGKAASILGPFLFGLATQLAGLRFGVLVLALFFIAGGTILAVGVTDKNLNTK